MKELEVKILNIDIENIRKKTTELNCVKVKEENQINNLFDFKTKDLLKQQGYARIRIVQDLLHDSIKYYMTTKKILSQDKFKIMDENEVEISDAIEGEKIFKALGLELIQSIKKYRESYKYKNSLIEMDINDKSFCPFAYVEIETADDRELAEIVNLLGYSMKDITSKTIYEILQSR
mgnify:CR=1 FL=1